jgi:hypothetical protein
MVLSITEENKAWLGLQMLGGGFCVWSVRENLTDI